jgi:hypothetical protein
MHALIKTMTAAVLATTFAGVAAAADSELDAAQIAAMRDIQIWVVAAAMLILMIISIALYGYLRTLRDRLGDLADRHEDARKLYMQMALGVPDGTIRSALAVLIVIGALLTLVAAMGEFLGFKVPEALTGVFGTILGFYFGRAGSVESSQATAAMAGAAQISSEAKEQKAQAAHDVAAATASAEDAKKTASATRLKTVMARIDPITRAMDSIIGFAPPTLLAASVAKWKALRDAITAASNTGSLDQLETALAQLSKEGPVAELISQVSPELAPMAKPGQSGADVARALIEFNVTLSPEVAQRWALRVLGLPFRAEVIEPVIDDAYATSLIQSSPISTRLLQELRDKPGDTPVSAANLVRTVLTDDAVATLTEELGGRIAEQDIAAVVEQLQKRAIEQQLERDIPPEKVASFGDLKSLFLAIDRVRASAAGQQALDIVLGIVRRARAAGVPIADLLSPEH